MYLVNKPLSVAGMSGDNAQGLEIVQKMNSWPRSEACLNVRLFLDFSAIEIKSDNGYQIGQRISSDNHRPIVSRDQFIQ